MAVLTGTLRRTSSGGATGGGITVELEQFAVLPTPQPGYLAVRSAGGNILITSWPVEANPRALTGSRRRIFVDDWYYRIHINPHRIDLGNVVSTQTSLVRVWNAYLTPVTLQEIESGEEGVLVVGQPEPPFSIAALKELSWSVSVTPDGQPVLDTHIEWRFAGGHTARLRITANRIVAWSLVPDWADGILEELEWKTDVLASETMVEQRRALRLSPRRVLEALVFAEGRERQLLDLMLYSWGSRVWALPIWPDIQLLAEGVPLGSYRINCQTVGLDFEIGGIALLRGDDAFTYEVVEVSDIDATGLDLTRPIQQQWPARSRLYPARPAQLLEEPQLTRMTDQLQSLTVRFLILDACDWPDQMPATSYRGRAVLDTAPDESEDLTSTFARLQATLDSGLGLPLLTDLAQRAMPVCSWRWIDMGRAKRSELRSLLYALRGQQVPLWIPTFADDLTVVADIPAAVSHIDVRSIGYTRFASARPGRRDIRIQLNSGAVFYRRISSSTELEGHIERLAIDSALGLDVPLGAVARISWMVLSRLASDRAVIEHETDSEGVATCALTFRGVRDDEF